MRPAPGPDTRDAAHPTTCPHLPVLCSNLEAVATLVAAGVYGSEPAFDLRSDEGRFELARALARLANLAEHVRRWHDTEAVAS